MSKPSTNLLLSADRAAWASSPTHGTRFDEKNHELYKMRDKILSRDHHTCQGCGWKSKDWQEIHHRNGDHRDHSEGNLETLCPLCHQVFHLPIAAATGGGSIIWLPEMPQGELNLLCIGLFVAMKNPKGRWAGIARTVFSALESRKSFMDEHLGRSDPGVLAQVLINLTPEEYARREAMVGSLRLLPYAARFQGAIDYWEATNFKSLPEDKWEEMLPSDLDLSTLAPDA